MDKAMVMLAAVLAEGKVRLAALYAKSKAVAMSLAVAASLTLPAFATEEGSGGGLGAVTGAADTVTTFVTKAFTMMTGNPLLCVYLASGLISVGIYKFAQLRRAAH